MLRITTADGRAARWCSADTSALDAMVEELYGGWDGVQAEPVGQREPPPRA